MFFENRIKNDYKVYQVILYVYYYLNLLQKCNI